MQPKNMLAKLRIPKKKKEEKRDFFLFSHYDLVSLGLREQVALRTGSSCARMERGGGAAWQSLASF